MDQIGNGGGGCMATIGFCLLMAIAMALLVIVPRSCVDMRLADAQRIEARADLEQVRMERDHQQAVDWMHEYELYTTVLLSPAPLSIVAGIAGLVIGFLLLHVVNRQIGNMFDR